jgi:hypothetical protein
MTTLLCLLLAGLSNQPVVDLDPAASEPLPTFGAPSALTTYSPAPRPDDFPEMEYTYVEANYLVRDSDAANETLDGWELTGSFELPANIFLQATVNKLSGDADLTGYRVGAGWHFGFTSRFDAYGILSYDNLKLDGSGNDFSDDSVAAEVGLRVLLTRSIEVNGRGQWTDTGDGDPSFGVGGRFYFSGALSAGLRVDTTGNDTIVAGGLRFEL